MNLFYQYVEISFIYKIFEHLSITGPLPGTGLQRESKRSLNLSFIKHACQWKGDNPHNLEIHKIVSPTQSVGMQKNK